jgi:hypothetical protein
MERHSIRERRLPHFLSVHQQGRTGHIHADRHARHELTQLLKPLYGRITRLLLARFEQIIRAGRLALAQSLRYWHTLLPIKAKQPGQAGLVVHTARASEVERAVVRNLDFLEHL